MIEIVDFKRGLHQWDVNRTVRITDIDADKVHVANIGDSKAAILDIFNSEAKIPNFLLQTGKQLCVYAVKNGVTVASKTFFVTHRERPENYVYEDDRRNYIYELIGEMETAIANANEAADRANHAARNAGVFVGVAGDTTFDEFMAAVDAEMSCFVYYEDRPYALSGIADGNAVFYSWNPVNGNLEQLKLDNMDGPWVHSSFRFVKTINGNEPDENGNIQVSGGSGGGTGGNVDVSNLQTDETLKIENGILSVNTTNRSEQDNTLPITSAGVFEAVGNIEALLKTI